LKASRWQVRLKTQVFNPLIGHLVSLDAQQVRVKGLASVMDLHGQL
jgi:hypothetical protein